MKYKMDGEEFYPPRWDFKILFLRRLYKASLSRFGEYQKNIFKNLLGDLDGIISDFINLGLIKKLSFIDRLDISMTVKQLKEYLISKNVKSTGNKNDLMIRATNLFSVDERRKIEKDGDMYILTEEGWGIVNNDNERFQSELRHFESRVVFELLDGKYESAFKNVSDFYFSYPFPIGMGVDWSNGFHEQDREVIYHIMKSDYLLQSMNCTEQLKKKIRAIISANYLFQFAGFSKGNISEKILSVVPEFKCEQIERFLEVGPTGIFRSRNSKSPADIAEIFNHSFVSYSLNQVKLRSILKDQGNERRKGVKILAGKSPVCEYCSKVLLEYEWKNLKSLPILPIFPGCICTYLIWFRNE